MKKLLFTLILAVGLLSCLKETPSQYEINRARMETVVDSLQRKGILGPLEEVRGTQEYPNYDDNYRALFVTSGQNGPIIEHDTTFTVHLLKINEFWTQPNTTLTYGTNDDVATSTITQLISNVQAYPQPSFIPFSDLTFVAQYSNAQEYTLPDGTGVFIWASFQDELLGGWCCWKTIRAEFLDGSTKHVWFYKK